MTGAPDFRISLTYFEFDFTVLGETGQGALELTAFKLTAFKRPT
jgi:hypothetical protein